MANEKTNKALEKAAVALSNLNATEPAAEGAKTVIEGLLQTIEANDVQKSKEHCFTGDTLSPTAANLAELTTS